MKSVIGEFHTLRLTQQEKRLAGMTTFLKEFAEWDPERRARKVDFNLFSLFKIETDEVRHSRFLAWLLDARSGHGQGSMFLRAFVEACHLDIPLAALDRYRVQTEVSGIESIIDLSVTTRGAFVIYLENKILASEGLDQLNRELRDMRRVGRSLRVPRARQFAVFLTPEGRAPTSGDAAHWVSISYGQLARAFEKLLPEIENAKVRDVLQDWIEAILVFGGAYELAV
jgi:hypothetical protein